MLYSQTTGGFYSRAIHGDNIPADAVEITTEQHAALLHGQSECKVIAADDNGYPILVDPPAPTPEQLATQARADRDARLKASDWVALRALETGEPVPPEWLAYRQALRDVPEQAGFPESIDWPVEPETV